MTRRVAILCVVVLCTAAPAAMPKSFGAGIILGEPTGLSFKQWTGRGEALDAGAAWSFEEDAALHFHMDYLVHKPTPPEMRLNTLMFYFGIGGRVKLEEDDNRAGVRIPLGLNYIFREAKLDFFFEAVPILDLAPETEFNVNGGIGLRYYLF